MPPQPEHPFAALIVVWGAVMVLVGVISVISPARGWWLSAGWKFRNAEPSDAGLFMTRVGGVALIFAGIYVATRHF